MKTRNLLFVAMACMGLLSPVHAEVLKVETPNTQLVLDATEGQQLAMLYYGDKSATMEDVRNQMSDVRNQMSDIRCQRFMERVLQEGQCRPKKFELGGADRYDERERVKRLPVWRRKIMTLQERFANARFLKQYAPAYARHVLWANIRKGIRRTIRRERMIDY